MTPVGILRFETQQQRWVCVSSLLAWLGKTSPAVLVRSTYAMATCFHGDLTPIPSVVADVSFMRRSFVAYLHMFLTRATHAFTSQPGGD